MRIMAVDASPIIYQVHNTPMGKFSIQNGPYKGENTGVRYGFLRSVRSYAEKLKAEKIVICWDMQGEVLKAKDVKDYKANRPWNDSKEMMYAQVPALKDMILLTGWTQAYEQGYEADDLLGLFARKFQKEHQITIVTTDDDLLQLCAPSVTVYKPGKDGRVKDEKFVNELYGVPPCKLLVWRAVEGDGSDNLPGVDIQEREKRDFKNYLNLLGNPIPIEEAKEHTIAYFMKHHSKEHLEALERNLKVMSLVAPETITIKKGLKDKEGLTKLFERLEFKSMMRFIDDLCK